VRILILSQFFDPEPTLKGLGFAQALVALGHEVEVLTGFPNYPGGKIYPGYKVCPWRREVMDGITINRVAIYPSHDRSVLRRLLNYFSFAISASMIGPWLVKRPDVLYVYHPPLTISLPAAVLKLINRCPIVYDIQDLWPDTLASTGMVRYPFILKVVGIWAIAAYKNAKRIVVLSPGFRTLLIQRGVPADKIRTIYNWNEEKRQGSKKPDRQFARKWGLDGKFNVVYAGSFGPAQALDCVLDAADLCREEYPEVQFILIGQGMDRDRLESRVQREGLSNVKLIPQQTMMTMSGIFPLADALLVHSKDDPLFSITIPSKTQAYLAAGRPVVMAARGNAANLIRKSHAGFTIAPEKPNELFKAVCKLADMSEVERKQLGDNGREYYERELSLGVGIKQFEKVFKEAVALTETRETDQASSSSFYKKYGKRALDLAIVIPSLILLSPLFFAVIVVSAIRLGWPVTFQQLRAGKNGKIFRIYKFRSMTFECNSEGVLLPDSERTPKYGAFLRRTSIDELPGLINVLMGDMSLVGPRPLLPEYLPYYSVRDGRRHEVVPGITGAAQLSGRQLATFSERMQKDVWYVDHVSLLTDIRLLLQTIPKVFGLQGVVVGQDVRDVDDLGLSYESRQNADRSIGKALQ